MIQSASPAPLCFVICGDVEAAPVMVDAAIAGVVLEALGLSPDGFGCIEPRELAARCRRRLWPEFAGGVERCAVRSLLSLAQRAGADILYC